jgi:hypothetical protein
MIDLISLYERTDDEHLLFAFEEDICIISNLADPFGRSKEVPSANVARWSNYISSRNPWTMGMKSHILIELIVSKID